MFRPLSPCLLSGRLLLPGARPGWGLRRPPGRPAGRCDDFTVKSLKSSSISKAYTWPLGFPGTLVSLF